MVKCFSYKGAVYIHLFESEGTAPNGDPFWRGVCGVKVLKLKLNKHELSCLDIVGHNPPLCPDCLYRLIETYWDLHRKRRKS